MDVYDAIPTIVTTFVVLIAKISIFIFLLQLVYYTNNSLSEMSWTFILLMSSLFSLIVGTVVGLSQFRIKRLFAYSTIVRRCALFIHGIKDSMQCSYLHPALELGEGESPTSNLASPLKRFIKLIQICWLGIWAAFSMIKTILSEVYLQGSSTIGNCLVWYRAGRLNRGLRWWSLLWTNPFLGITNTFKAESGQSKENLGINLRTTGLPKVINDYGNRGIIVPLGVSRHPSRVLKGSVALGRIPGQWNRNYSNTAGDTSTVKSDAIRKLQWLGEKCKENKNYVVRDIFNMMYNTKLYEMAYNNLKSNPGNMTPGITPTTLDGFSAEAIQEIIEKLRDDSFQFKPGRRVMITKASGGEIPLTVAPPRDKIVQEVMRMILEVIFEPSFSPNSHGFRSEKSCHTALKQIFTTFGSATWYIESDISKCFDTFNHEILIKLIRTRMKDERFVRLIIKALKAGYFEFKESKHSIIGTPQGSIISPILCNIYMNGFDKFMEELSYSLSKGTKYRGNPIWISYNNKKIRSTSIAEKIKWHRLMLTVPSKDAMDPNFKKLVYVRYADDWIAGVWGSREDCVMLLEKIKTFLKEELKLNLSENKTLITNADKGKALFLGTNIYRSRHQVFNKSVGFAKRIGKEIRLVVPLERAINKLRSAKFLVRDVPSPRFLWLHNSKDQIVALYNSVYRGFINYYSFAHNLGSFSGYLHIVLKSSCAKLLAAKFNLKSQRKIFKLYGKNLLGKDKIAFVDPVYKNNHWDFKTPSDKRVDALISDNGIL